jgi:tRNA(Leu) C34 or U34 (ribose-2'-O)-methylase TrmL
MKFSKEDIGVFIGGASLYNITEQNFKILDFAVAQGFELDENELEHAKLDYIHNTDELGYDWHEELGYVVEDALHYLNTNCVEPGVAFTFRDTEFVLIGENEFE